MWFVLERDRLFLLPVTGSDGDWYKNVLKAPTIRIAADGGESRARATPITAASKVRDIVERFRTKYGADDVERYHSKLDVAVEVPLA